ncbi:hypothetical protein CsSME_00048983 [Camellia sinensis var. sinensis]
MTALPFNNSTFISATPFSLVQLMSGDLLLFSLKGVLRIMCPLLMIVPAIPGFFLWLINLTSTRYIVSFSL